MDRTPLADASGPWGRSTSATAASWSPSSRAQSSVVAVAVLLAATALAIGVLTASIGAVVSDRAAASDADRVAAAVADVTRPGGPGPHHERLTVSGGTVETRPREVRLLNDSGVVHVVAADALVYRAGTHRVASVAGGLSVDAGGGAVLERGPGLAVGNETVVLGVTSLNGSVGLDVAEGSGARLSLRTDVAYERWTYPADEYRIAIETTSPAAWERHFEARGFETDRVDVDGDGVPSVVVVLDGRDVDLVVRDLALEVGA